MRVCLWCSFVRVSGFRWDCHGGSVTTLDPPQLIRVSSDPSERYSLLEEATWKQHLQWLVDSSKVDPALASLVNSEYFAQVLMTQSLSDYCPAIANHSINASAIPSIANKDGAGYSGTAVAEGKFDDMYSACVAKCCADVNCAAITLQTTSKNHGMPKGACQLGEPCCWLLDKDAAAAPFTDDTNATSAYVRGTPPDPDPYPVPSDPTGQYSDLLKHFATAIGAQLQTMVRETIPSGAAGDLSPCCGDGQKDASGVPVCTCGYGPDGMGGRHLLRLGADGAASTKLGW